MTDETVTVKINNNPERSFVDEMVKIAQQELCYKPLNPHKTPTEVKFVDCRDKEEWIWVTGYKGTDKDMKCHNDYQYELGELFEMPVGSKIKECKSGFHLCMNIADVRKYQRVGNNNRYFEVQALVRKSDVEEYGVSKQLSRTDSGLWYYTDYTRTRDKLVAKSIIFTRELSIDEILEGTEACNWPEEYKKMAVEESITRVRNDMLAKELATLGYSEAFSQYIVGKGWYEDAKKVSSQKDLSMDMKVLAIIKDL